MKDMRTSVGRSIADAVSRTIKKVTAPVTKLLKKLTGRTPLTTPQPGKAKSNGKPVDVQVYTDQNGKVWIKWNPEISEDDLAEIAKKQKSCKPKKVHKKTVDAVKEDKKKENEKAYEALTKEEKALGESLGGCDLPVACKTREKAACFIAGTSVHVPGAVVPIERFKPGRRAVTFDDADSSTRRFSDSGLDSSEFRMLQLELQANDSLRTEVVLLRSPAWIEDYGAHVGGTVFLDLPEMGVEGSAEVLAVVPCPPLEEGEGRLVTGTFRHTSGEVYDLKLESESMPIGVTATHPFWSVDRNGWFSVVGGLQSQSQPAPWGFSKKTSLGV
jgi:hypothetical protein